MMPGQGEKILIIEDDKFLLKILSERVRREGFHVFMASTGEEGIARLASDEPDLVLLDIILPGKNGFEVLTEMMRRDEWKHIPVIVISNLGQTSDIERAKTLGARDYIVKTDLNLREMIQKVKEGLLEKKPQKA